MDTADDGALLIMSDAVLLILRVPESDDQGVALRKVNGRLDVSTTGDDFSVNEYAAKKAFIYAGQSSRYVVALQILSSNLFHWGLCDNISSGTAKVRFVSHVREQLLIKSQETTRMLEQIAGEYNVSYEIKKVETDDPASAAIEEARGDYDRIFMGKEENRIFPLFKKSMGQILRKKITVPIVAV